MRKKKSLFEMRDRNQALTVVMLFVIVFFGGFILGLDNDKINSFLIQEKEPFNPDTDVCLEWEDKCPNENYELTKTRFGDLCQSELERKTTKPIKECVSWEKKEEVCGGWYFVNGNKNEPNRFSGVYISTTQKDVKEECNNYALENYCNQNPNDNEICSCNVEVCFNEAWNIDCRFKDEYNLSSTCQEAVPRGLE